MNIGWKLVSLATGAIAGLIARQIVGLVWEKGLKQEKPTGDDDHDLELPAARVAAFAAVTAGVTSLVNEVLKRKTTEWYGSPSA